MTCLCTYFSFPHRLKRSFYSARVGTIQYLFQCPVSTSSVEEFIESFRYIFSLYCLSPSRALYAIFSSHVASSNTCGDLVSNGGAAVSYGTWPLFALIWVLLLGKAFGFLCCAPYHNFLLQPNINYHWHHGAYEELASCVAAD